MDEITMEFTSEEEVIAEQPAPEEKPQRPRPQRRRPSKQQVFKERMLPMIILATAGVLIVTFIIGSIVRASQKRKIEMEASIAASESVAAEEARIKAEVESILTDAANMAAAYNFEGAIARINEFSGNIGAFPQLQDAKVEYEYGLSTMTPWEDHNAIINLSFQTLIADPERAYANPEYGTSLEKNFITVTEFQKILEQLYENDYILVSPKDFVDTSDPSNYKYKELLLPEGKKPVMITETMVNYFDYMIDLNDDDIPDYSGFANKLVLDKAALAKIEEVFA